MIDYSAYVIVTQFSSLGMANIVLSAQEVHALLYNLLPRQQALQERYVHMCGSPSNIIPLHTSSMSPSLMCCSTELLLRVGLTCAM